MTAESPSSPVERRVSRRIGAIAESATLKVDAKAKALKAEGRPVIGFGAGEPDFPTPSYIVEAAVEACRDPKNHRYTPAGGLPELKQAIADKTLRDSGYAVQAGQIVVTNGGKQAIYEAFATMLDPGDEVIVPAPYWTTYPEAIQLAGGVAVPVVADETHDYKVTVEQLEAARTAQTKVLLFVSPSNPTGAVYTADEIRAIGAWVEEHRLWVLTDEIYEHLVYDDTETGSLPVLCPGVAERCVVVNGVAKTYAMTGWRVGWLIGSGRRGQGRHQPPVARDLQRQQRRPARRTRRRRGRPGRGRGDEGGLRPPPPDDRLDARRDRRRRVPDARGRVLRLPVGQGAARPRHTTAGSSRPPPSWPSTSWSRPRWRSSPARRSGRPDYLRLVLRARVTTTWSRASPGCRSCSRWRTLTARRTATRSRDRPSCQGAPAPALHRLDAARDAARAGRAGRNPCCPTALVSEWPPQLSAADEKGWFRFQRLYDVARSVLRTEDDVRRLVREAAEDDVRDGGRWLEIQVDPSGTRARFGGITAFTDLVLDAVRETSIATGLGIAVVVAANRTRHPLDARDAGPARRAVRRPRAWSASGSPTTSAAA